MQLDEVIRDYGFSVKTFIQPGDLDKEICFLGLYWRREIGDRVVSAYCPPGQMFDSLGMHSSIDAELIKGAARHTVIDIPANVRYLFIFSCAFSSLLDSRARPYRRC